jgi:hypothetical protein
VKGSKSNQELMVDKDFSEDDVDSYKSIKKEEVSKQKIFLSLKHILPIFNFMDSFFCSTISQN